MTVIAERSTAVIDSRPTVETLVTRVAAGDRDSLAALYDEVGGAVYGLAGRLLRDPMRAEQVVRDVFVEIWHQAPNRRPTATAARPWIAALVRSSCVDVLRRGRADGCEPAVQQTVEARGEVGR